MSLIWKVLGACTSAFKVHRISEVNRNVSCFFYAIRLSYTHRLNECTGSTESMVSGHLTTLLGHEDIDFVS